MTYLLGLTGSMGMGKSTTAQMFAEEGCAIYDADAAVHRLYSEGGAAVEQIASVLPEAIVDGAVSREKLKAMISQDEIVLKTIEKIVHPLVKADREEFIAKSEADITVLDVPLLFETGCHKDVDAVVVVTADIEDQKRRLLQRARMTPKQLETILKMQAPDAEKRAMADYVIKTDTIEHARAQVKDIVSKIRESIRNA
jgi:dephospho-CoA kinase